MMKQYDSYKDSGVEWIGKIPSHWEVVKLKYDFDIYAGATPKTEVNEYWDGDITWITPADYKTGDKYITSGQRSITKEGYNSCNTQIVPKGSLVFSKRAPIGTVAISGVELCTNQGCLSCVPRNTNVQYFYYLTSVLTEVFDLFGSGATFKEISADTFANFRLPCPSLEEQESIANYLDKKCGEIDKAITTQEKRVELLKELRQNIITQAVTRGINPNAPLKDSGVEWIGEVPEHWEVNRLKTLCRTIRNGYVGPTRDLYVDDGIPYIQSVHIKDGDILFEREEYYVTKDWADKHPKIYKGDIVVVQTGDIGQIALVTNKFDKSNCHALIILSINNNVISSEYLSLYLRSHIGKELMLQTKTGALLPHLNSTQIGDTTTIVPPLSEQQEIVSYIESQTVRLDKSIEKAEHQIELLQELKQSIITEVVTGKRKVV